MNEEKGSKISIKSGAASQVEVRDYIQMHGDYFAEFVLH